METNRKEGLNYSIYFNKLLGISLSAFSAV
jgi:hypothetical protein